MNRWLNGLRWALGIGMLSGALTIGGFGLVNVTTGGAWAESEHEHEEDEHEHGERVSGKRIRFNAQQPIPDTAYMEECSACHIAYPAQLLPARSWSAMMSGLADHFGENAELAPDTAKQISEYLMANAADVNPGRRSSRFLRKISANDTPLRITRTPFFKRKHHEVPKRQVTGNPDVGSFSQCQACHGQDAQRGIFDEDTVDIPGYGRWD